MATDGADLCADPGARVEEPDGGVEEAVDSVSAWVARACGGLFDDPTPIGADGAIPPLWHWLAFRQAAPQADLGPDGHPSRAAFGPGEPFRRRMFAGGRLRWTRALVVGEPLRRRSTVAGVRRTVGRSGPLLFVTVRQEFRPEPTAGHGDEPVLVEEEDIVYRPAAATGPAPVASTPTDEATGNWPWVGELAVGPVLLFRFSALTFNAHRIHYDRDYAVGTEGYPGLVVHGPLQAMALAELFRRQRPSARVTGFEFRALQPAFDGSPLVLRGRPDGPARVRLAAFRDDGTATMHATVAFADGSRSGPRSRPVC